MDNGAGKLSRSRAFIYPVLGGMSHVALVLAFSYLVNFVRLSGLRYVRARSQHRTYGSYGGRAFRIAQQAKMRQSLHEPHLGYSGLSL